MAYEITAICKAPASPETDNLPRKNIVLPPLPILTNEQQEDRIARHDIAQRLMSKKLGFETGQLFIGTRFGKPSSLSNNRSKALAKLDSSVTIAEHLRKRIMILFSGVMSDVQYFEKLVNFEMKKAHLDSIYNSGVPDGSWLTDKDKIEELLVALCGIEYEPGESYQRLVDQMNDTYSELYRAMLSIFDSFAEKLPILADLAIKESWNRGRLIVSDERLVDLEAEADTLLRKKLSPRE